ncbi:MAG: DEAD/DEAH box helicase [Propionibacteriaceae bacterium]
MTSFVSLGVSPLLVSALAERDITEPTPIQAATLPDTLLGRDVLGRGRTGSGKTYAFLLPLVSRLLATSQRRLPQAPRALILAPTRELAAQIEESLTTLLSGTSLTYLTIFGGVNQNPQARALRKGIDVLIACPGRLLDLKEQGLLDLSQIEITVLDEADHMADMGFLPMVKRILDATPTQGQRMLFSATLDNGVDILVKRYLHNPCVHEADSAVSSVAEMDHHVIIVGKTDKVSAVADLGAAPGRTIVFTRTKHGAKKLVKQLLAKGVPAVDLHGNLSQNARTRNLAAFHEGRVTTLVATDIAARGIHVDDIELVVHADPPAEHKAYLHRSGRTARAGKSGTVLTLAMPEQKQEVRDLMRAAKITPTTHTDMTGALRELAPGERVWFSPQEAEALAYPNSPTPQQRSTVPSRRPANATGSRDSGGKNHRSHSKDRNGSRPSAPTSRGRQSNPGNRKRAGSR